MGYAGVMKGIGWLGVLLVTVPLHGQGISAVTRPTRMAGPPQAAMGGTLPATLPGGGGGQGGLAVSPNWSGAAAMFAPVLVRPTAAGLPPAPSVSGPVATARPAASRVPSTPAADPAEVQARVLAFQQEQARQGSPSAQLALGRRYLAGDGLERNEAVGRVWLEAAARQGSTEARQESSRLAGPWKAGPSGAARKD